MKISYSSKGDFGYTIQITTSQDKFNEVVENISWEYNGVKFLVANDIEKYYISDIFLLDDDVFNNVQYIRIQTE